MLWFEECYDGGCLRLRAKKLFEKNSKYQKIEIYETESFGRMLALDSTVQFTERDEFIYHEALAHTPLHTHQNPKRVLIIGGGDGGIARECLKHGIDVVLVEIDEEVIKACKEYFPDLSRSLEEIELYVMDGFYFLKNNDRKFDVIIVDSTDPVGEAKKLFEEEFYNLVKNSLDEDGIYAMQLGSFWYHTKNIRENYMKLKKIFDNVEIFTASIPTYPGALWIFGIASDREITLRRSCRLKLKYYSDEIYKSSFILPRYIKDVIGIEH